MIERQKILMACDLFSSKRTPLSCYNVFYKIPARDINLATLCN